MEKLLENAGKVGAENHPKPTKVSLTYGTAGFRTKADVLDHVLYRMGLLASLRSKCQRGAAIGVMITASHNPEEDNGVKLIDPFGEMLQESWETHAAQLANAHDSELSSCLKSLIDACEIDTDIPAKVVFAKDTRPSSASLAKALQDGLDVFQTKYTDYGLLTTPQLHYMVRCINSNGLYGDATEQGYYNKLSKAFKELREKRNVNAAEVAKSEYKPCVVIDGANGVGAPQMSQMTSHISQMMTININNDGTSGKLNHKCGADYVKIQQQGPEGLNMESGQRYASFDGDADRIVFYYVDDEAVFHLLDGDKIATLFAGFLKELLTESGLDLNLGLVQTAYANGSSTKYITNTLNVPVACAATGVKHLHHRALEFDVGVYFEANGHGTVLFSAEAERQIRELAEESSGSVEQKAAAKKLSAFVDLVNQTVGDAISDLLVVETILYYRGWSVMNWDSTYADLPNRQLKVKVKDRTVIQTTDAERRTTSPAGLQSAIDNLVTKYDEGRSFVRPSGTEDVVRVYAEANSRELADKLAREVSIVVYNMAGGIGDGYN